MIFPDKKVKIPNAKTETAEVPAAKPSIPSIKLKALMMTKKKMMVNVILIK